jgi:hypothetical protein
MSQSVIAENKALCAARSIPLCFSANVRLPFLKSINYRQFTIQDRLLVFKYYNFSSLKI